MIKIFKLSRVSFILQIYISLILLAYGCTQNYKTLEYVQVHDTVFVEKIRIDTLIFRDTVEKEVEVVQVGQVLEPEMYDSAESRRLLEKSLWSKHIDRIKSARMAELETRTDLEYLPYYLSLCSDLDRDLPFGFPAYLFVSLCTESIDDENLFELGKCVIDNLNTKRGQKYWDIEYPDAFTKGGMETYRVYQPFKPTAVDTLRVKVIAHNDLEALKALEKYYRDNGDDKGIAIYYKILLSYEGNGDLAERFFKVLEPHFEETPELRLAVREVLLRAALCDHNARAQELCDSLGFSLCDYRLPLPE